MERIIYIDGFIKYNPTKSEKNKILMSRGYDTDYLYANIIIPAEMLITDNYIIDFKANKVYYILDTISVDNFIKLKCKQGVK